MKRIIITTLAVIAIAFIAACGSKVAAAGHSPKPVFTTQAEKNAEHRAERDFLACVQQHGLTSVLSHSGRTAIASCMGFAGKVKKDAVTCMENQVLNAGSLLTSADRARIKAALVSCMTTAELAQKS